MLAIKKAFVSGLTCKLCNEWVTMLTHTHMKVKHNTTQFEYLVQYPEHCDSTVWGNVHGLAARKKFNAIRRRVTEERKVRGYNK